MFSRFSSLLRNEASAKLKSLDRSQALIEFDLDGNIITANKNFLDTMGYGLEEIKGRHHSMFVDPDFAKSTEYRQFWEKLRRKEHDTKECRRIGKNGKEVWIQASYSPIADKSGKPFKVVKFATDVTRQKLDSADHAGQIAAINKSQAVIHFNLDGIIVDANENFLAATGYELQEVKGRHHNMFVDPVYGKSVEYQQFWEKLRRGEFDSGEYKRYGKGGREIWIQASYNPIFDMNGKPFKVVKFATDITKQKLENANFSGQIAAIGKSQAVIHFNLDGTIIDANENFLAVTGYSLNEIKGKHHSMFVEPAYAGSEEYKQFWEKLRRGEFESREYKRVGKHGKEIWIQASYNPIFDMNGKPFKVVKFATDITALMATRLQVSNLVDQTYTSIQSVAAASEEMSASIVEISKNMNLSKVAVDDIVEKTQSAGAASTQMLQSSKSMETVVSLIRDIAEQVNLLALNATIEAARAGEAGKGFAVVASEVKNLANQTSAATNGITEEISSIQKVSEQVAASVSDVVAAADSVSQYVNSVASAIEEQSVVTKDISASAQITSQSVHDISECVKLLSAA